MRWRPRLPAADWLDLLLGLAVLAFGVLETVRDDVSGSRAIVLARCLVPAGIGLAVALHRRQPGLALAAAWATCAVQLVTGQDLIFVEFAVVVVAYGTARYGSVPVLIASLLSVPAAYPIALASAHLDRGGAPELTILAAGRLGGEIIRPGVVVVAAAVVVLMLPWLLGFALRMRDRAARSQALSTAAERDRAAAEDQRGQAQRLAEARAEQTRLARDVHDVVGHSLAVILAQAQSGDYLPDSDPERLKQAMRNIADSARASLQDVRRILAATSSDPRDADGDGPDAGPRGEDLDRLLDDVRAAGLDIRETVTGAARPLPPALATTVYRVAQEMLTNAIKHGTPDGPVSVRRDWTDGLVIEVSNVRRAGPPAAVGGRGLNGMRERLAGAGGTLTVSGDRNDAGEPREHSDQHEPGDQAVFTVRAWLPLPRQPGAAAPGRPREVAG